MLLKYEIQPTVINFHLMNVVKNYTTIHLWLNQINVFGFVILLMTYQKQLISFDHNYTKKAAVTCSVPIIHK